MVFQSMDGMGKQEIKRRAEGGEMPERTSPAGWIEVSRAELGCQRRLEEERLGFEVSIVVGV